MPGISTFSPASLVPAQYWATTSHDIRHVERAGGVGLVSTNTSWVGGLAVYVPFTLEVDAIVYEWFLYNGTLTTSHNLDFGIYNLDFTKVQSLGSTAGGTTASALNNTSTWTDLTLKAGSYYMAFVDDSTRNITTTPDAIGLYQVSGIMEQTGLGSTLPSPMVPVVYTRAFLPHFGMNLGTVVL